MGPHPLRNWELKQIKTSLFTVGELRGRSSLLLEAVLAGVSDATEKHIRKPPGLWCWYFCLAAEGFSFWMPSPSPSQWGAETCSKRRAELGNHWSAKRISEDISWFSVTCLWKPVGFQRVWEVGKARMGLFFCFSSLLPDEPGSRLPPRAEQGLGGAGLCVALCCPLHGKGEAGHWASQPAKRA